MFTQFYRDIDRLHELVKPFYYSVAMNRLAEAWGDFGREVGELVLPTINGIIGERQKE